jgi:regulator of sigma E protease
MDLLSSASQYLMTPAAFVAVLGILIFVHEFGHFIVARRLGVGVTKFSLGFGPKLFGIKRGETEYLVSAIPLGGYVKLVGDSEGDKVPEELQGRSFSNKPIRVKMAIVAAGPLANLLFAVLVFWVVFLGGVPALTPKIGSVVPDSPAARAGLADGDVVVRIDGENVATWEELASRIRKESSGNELSLTVRREGRELVVKVSPEIREGKSIFGETVSEPRIGIVAGQEIIRRKLGPAQAFVRAGAETGKLVELTVMTVVKLLSRVLPSETLGGPILIAQLAGDQARQGFSPFIYFLGLLSVNLGVLNLLPIPILDGGHILFFSIEALLRKPLSAEARAVAQQVGLALILMLTALVFYNDIARLVAR